MRERLGIGIVGLGAHAQRGHIDHLVEIERADIVAVCDPSAEARERQRAAGFTGPAYESLEEMLSEDRVRALVICSPDSFHAGALARGVAAGKHVLVEKPVADRLTDLRLVMNAIAQARRSRLVVTSCHPRRFDPPFTWLRHELPALRAQLGNPLDVRFDFFYHKPSKGGLHHGLLIDHINHEIDLIHFLFGYSPFVVHKLADSEVCYGAAGSRQDGLCFGFFGSRHLNRRAYTEVMRVRFERGEVEVDTETGVAAGHDRETATSWVARCGATDYEQRFHATNSDFVNAVLDGAAPYLTTADLIINTEVGITLTENGSYDSRQSVAASLLSPPAGE